MKSHARVSFLALLTGVLMSVALSASAQAAEAPAIEKLAAVNCSTGHEECAHEVKSINLGFPFGEQHYSVTKEPGKAEAEAEGFVKAAGHVPFGVTDFTLAHTGALPKEVPTATIKHIRTDVAPGLATSPAAVPMCSSAQFGKEELPKSGLYAAPTCSSESEIGLQQATVYLAAAGIDLALEGPVFNLEQPKGRSSEFGVSLKLPIAVTKGELEKSFAEHPLELPEPEKKLTEKALEEKQYYAHTLIEGNVEWGKEVKGTNQGDYHDYFEIEASTALPLVSSRLVFFGTKGGQFITNATSCPGHNTTTLKVTDVEEVTVERPFTTPIGLAECEKVPFEPLFSLTPGTTSHDEPNGFTAEAGLTRFPAAGEPDSAQLKTAKIALPEGMTLNPSAAAGLTACSPAEARIHSATPGVGCAKSSEVGTVGLNVPTLPPGSLSGSIYLGGPESGPITGPPYTIYVDAESERYGVSVRLKGEVVPNETTGQLTTTFSENPEQPFTSIALHFKEGALAPVANPLACGAPAASALFSPYTETAAKQKTAAFGVTGCPATLPFSPTQTTVNQSANAGGHTSYTFNLERPTGQQYLSQVSTTLPAGLVGAIPMVTQCGEPQAAQGTCTSASQIGTATVLAGAGVTPYAFAGPVYLTGPYNGAPFGLSIAVPAVAGPFNLGTVVTRATIKVDPKTARVTVASVLPRIVKGVPLRLRRISVAVEKQGFLFNPTNCSALATESGATGFTPETGGTATAILSSPFQVANCGALAFKPSFKAVTSAKTSKNNGASLETTINQPGGQANIKSVLVQLPLQLPSRLTTLQKACPEATFAANPFSCPEASRVGGARANTPTLPGKLSGPAYLVSHGGAAFPDLDLVMEANGVRVIVVGNTDIKKGITRTTFAATPDVPVSSITVNLPIGPHSALAGFGNLCAVPLVMPTTITGQNGKTIKQNTKIGVKGCGVQIVGHKVIGKTAYLTIRTFAPGRVSGRGSHLATVYRHFGTAVNQATLKIPLARGARRPLSTRVRVGFVPSRRGLSSSATFITLRFR